MTVQNASDSDDVPEPHLFRQWAETVLQAEQKDADLCIRVVNHEESASLNQQYRHKPGPTNVLSFPSNLPADINSPQLGDIVICRDVVVEEAGQQEKPVNAHWAHMVIHGVLHLLGHDHVETDQAEVMEQLEINHLQSLGFGNPYQ